ncbi:MAG TPA: efflux RND transporter periplasmic adaptor subunit [Bacteroidia bacterium]|nr:efflux RND transporter periplasmic adaptor subunit [Bacteroidia bacterium]
MAKKNNLLKYLLIGGGLLLILLVVARKAGWIGEDDNIKVTAEKVTTETIVETVSASGKVQPEVEVKLAADVSGEVVELFVKEGDVVKKGTLLAKINPEIYVSALDRVAASVNSSKANLENAKSRLTQTESQFNKAELTYNRNKKLFDEGVISSSDFESVKSAFEVAKAEVDAARQSVSASSFGVQSAEASLKESRENLNKTSIFAPVDGTISKLSVEKGERVVGTEMMAGTEVIRLANLNEMEVNVDVSESDIIRVNVGDTAIVDIDAYLNRTFTGVVTEIANSANTSSALSTDQVTNFTVKVRIIRDSYKDLIPADKPTYSPFRPGMSATVEIQTRKVYNVTAVPIQSVTTRDTVTRTSSKSVNTKSEDSDEESNEQSTPKQTVAEKKTSVQECVFVLKDGVVSLRPVKTGIQDNIHIQLLEGLKPGEEVITGPYNAISRLLKNGDRVKVVSKEELFVKEKE